MTDLKTPAPLRSFWSCLVGAIVAVVALLYAPWSAVFGGMRAGMAVVVDAIAAGFGMVAYVILATGQAGLAVALVIVITGLCVFLKAAGRQQRIQHEAWVGLAMVVSVVWLFFAFVIHVGQRVSQGQAASAVIRAFEAPASPEMALVHQMSEDDINTVEGVIAKIRNPKRELLHSYMRASGPRLTPQQFDTWHLAVLEFHDPNDHGHKWPAPLCQRLEKAYLSSPLEIQQRYRLTIAGGVVAPASSGPTRCRPYLSSSVEVRWAPLRPAAQG